MRNVLAAMKLVLTLKCEDSTRIVSESLDRELSLSERWAVRTHYLGCWSCRRFGKQVRQLREVYQIRQTRLGEVSRLSPAAVQRIRDAIRNDASS